VLENWLVCILLCYSCPWSFAVGCLDLFG